VLPDFDVIGLYLGIPYGSFLGHRGFSHSLFFAVLVGLIMALATSGVLALPWWLLWMFFFLVTASHTILDGFTNGGLGMAYFSPFDRTRYFFPWRPIRVSYIGLAFFRRQALSVLWSEIRWVWLPLAVIAGISILWRALMRT
jgi:inner membrane protein